MLQVLSPMNRGEILSKLIFQETTSIGLRQYVAKRTALEREMVPVSTRYGVIMMKVSKLDGGAVSCTPEYEDCARLAREYNIPLKEVQSLAVSTYQAKEAKPTLL